MSKKSDNSGLRYDSDKVRFDLIPPEVTLFLARVLTVGAQKYSERNWEKGMDWSRMVGSLKRHLTKWEMGMMYDPESGEPNLAHVLWNAMALLVYEQRGIGVDDLPSLDYDLARVEDLHRLPKEESTPPPEENVLSYLSDPVEEYDPESAIPFGIRENGQAGSAPVAASSLVASAHRDPTAPSPYSDCYSAWGCTTPGCCDNTTTKK